MKDRGVDRRTFLRGSAAVGAAVVAAGHPLRAVAGAAGAGETTALARVRADRAGIARLAASFDLTEHGRDGWYDVVLYPGDRARLASMGFDFRIVADDLVGADLRARAAEARAQASDPGTRLTYRTLAEYESDMRALATQNPGLVSLIELPYKTHEGRTVYGVEIADALPGARADGRPASLICGLHHAREWPSAELSIMFALDLVDEFRKGTAEIVELLRAVRVLVVPVVNPDGFVRSRETVSDFLAPLPGAVSVTGELAYHRKNMRKNGSTVVELGQGVDPNRNYPYIWGGPGASSSSSSQTYFGPGPGSEPEVKNLLWLLRGNQVLTLITNHTYSDLVLRPWGHTDAHAPDEPALKTLGDAMAKINGYRSIKGIQLYPTTGTTDDWHYGVCGGFGYTFEIGDDILLGNVTPAEGAGFHPQYNLHIPKFYARNRGAFLLLVQAARDTALHSVLQGTAPPGTRLTLRKNVRTPLGRSFGGAREIVEQLESSMVVGPSGSFAWHVNPSPLPDTVDRVRRGLAPVSALEPYELVAGRPDGSTSSQVLVAERGRSYTLAL